MSVMRSSDCSAANTHSVQASVIFSPVAVDPDDNIDGGQVQLLDARGYREALYWLRRVRGVLESGEQKHSSSLLRWLHIRLMHSLDENFSIVTGFGEARDTYG